MKTWKYFFRKLLTTMITMKLFRPTKISSLTTSILKNLLFGPLKSNYGTFLTIYIHISIKLAKKKEKQVVIDS